MLQDFEICLNTKFVFGKNANERVGDELKRIGIKKVLIHHDDGEYLYMSGLLPSLEKDLNKKEIEFVELGGVLPNPRLSLVNKGIQIARDEQIDFVLAIGGGSVIDSAKAIAIGALYDGDVWDFFSGKAVPEKTILVGSILTCPATGSESSQVVVVNNSELGLKLLVSDPIIRPAYAFMNPELTYSLPAFPTACGIVDMFSHACERYFAPDDEIGVIDCMIEGILKTLVDIGTKLLHEPRNYAYRSEAMWIGSIAHNNTVGVGRIQDWATHEIANELSALYDTPHGASLSIIMPSWMRYVYKAKVKRFVRYAKAVFGVDYSGVSEEQIAYEGIVRTEKFFKEMQMPISFEDLMIPTDSIEKMLDNIAFRGADSSIGGLLHLNRDDCREIYLMSIKNEVK